METITYFCPVHWVMIGKVVSMVVAPPDEMGARLPNQRTISGAASNVMISRAMFESKGWGAILGRSFSAQSPRRTGKRDTPTLRGNVSGRGTTDARTDRRTDGGGGGGGGAFLTARPHPPTHARTDRPTDRPTDRRRGPALVDPG